jgi:hypothetical protein
MSSVCYIELSGGLGSIVQSTPFIRYAKTKFDKVIGVDRALDKDSLGVLKGIVDGIIQPDGTNVRPKGSSYFKSPCKRSLTAAHECDEWFMVNSSVIPVDMRYSVGYSLHDAKYDCVVWSGACTGERPSRWPYWEQLVKSLTDRGLNVAMIKTASDTDWDFCNDMVTYIRDDIWNMGGIMMNSGFFIGDDGGVSKYSYALGCKTLVVTGACDMEYNYNLSHKTHIVKSGIGCSPCQSKPDTKCSSDMCLLTLTHDFVEECLVKIGFMK